MIAMSLNSLSVTMLSLDMGVCSVSGEGGVGTAVAMSFPLGSCKKLDHHQSNEKP